MFLIPIEHWIFILNAIPSSIEGGDVHIRIKIDVIDDNAKLINIGNIVGVPFDWENPYSNKKYQDLALPIIKQYVKDNLKAN